MATKANDRYPTVKAFQEALQQYQSHSESVALCDRAEHELNAAVASNDYRDFARRYLHLKKPMHYGTAIKRRSAGFRAQSFSTQVTPNAKATLIWVCRSSIRRTWHMPKSKANYSAQAGAQMFGKLGSNGPGASFSGWRHWFSWR